MPRVGTNPNWNRFNLILKKTMALFNISDVSQPEFIARCYDWIEPFAKIWNDHKSDEEYTSWLIYRGIGNTYSTSAGIKGIDFPYGLLNDAENRNKAKIRIRENFDSELSEEQLFFINERLIQYLGSDSKDGFITMYAKRVADIDVPSFDKFIRMHLIPSLEVIDEPFERLAAILIYAQSGCIPLDAYKIKSENLETNINENHSNKILREIYRSSDYHELEDPHFCGKFYGYFRQYNNQFGEVAYKGLVPFELNISNDGQGAKAELKFSRYTPSMHEIPIRMSGKPMIGQQAVHVVFQSDSGDDFITMSYRWINLNNGSLQSRHGVMLTLDRAERCPQVQQFVFFNQPISKENEKYINAFLRFSGDRLVISDENIAWLSDETDHFLKKYGKPFNGYMISVQQALLNAQYDNINDREIIKQLLELKQNALSSLVINAKEGKQMSDFFRAMLNDNAFTIKTEENCFEQ